MSKDPENDKAMRLSLAAKAEQLWAAMTASEKTGVRFGMFPAATMQAAEAQGYDGRLLALALMDQASKKLCDLIRKHYPKPPRVKEPIS